MGRPPGIVAAVAGAAAADFFFYPPLYTLWIRDPQDVVDLILFLLIALVTSNLAARLKNEAISLAPPRKGNRRAARFLAGPRDLPHQPRPDLRGADYLSNTLRYRAILIATAPDDPSPNDQAPFRKKFVKRPRNC